MADCNKIAIGNSNELNIDISRCLKMRFSESSCRRCIKICPHDAISINGDFVVDPEICRGCLLCTTVCPSGALEPKATFADCLSQLARVSEPVLGCMRTVDSAHGTIPCLGGLSEEHLLKLQHSMTEMVTVNLSLCSACPNSRVAGFLKERLEALVGAQLMCGVCRLVLAESESEINFRNEAVGRRGFFKSFGAAIFKSAEYVLVSTTINQPARSPDYGTKRLPLRRELLNQVKSESPMSVADRLEKRFDAQISFHESCSACQGCAAICPTGALQTTSGEHPPMFDKLKCTGCGLCAEFCQDQALELVSAGA